MLEYLDLNVASKDLERSWWLKVSCLVLEDTLRHDRSSVSELTSQTLIEFLVSRLGLVHVWLVHHQ